jgi:prophage regulatory protein
MEALMALATIHTPPERDRRRDNLLRIKDVIRRTGLSSSTIYRRTVDGTFPAKIMIGPSCAAWYESDIDDFVADPARFLAA